MSLRKRTAAGVLWTLAQTGYGNVLSLVVYLVLLSLLNPVDFGLVAAAGLFVQILRTVLDGGFGQVLLQREHVTQRFLSTIFWMSALLGLAFGLTLLLLAGPLSRLFDTEEPHTLSSVFAALAVVFPLAGLNSVPTAILRRDLNFKPLAIRTLVGTTGSSALAIVLALLDYGVWALVTQQVANVAFGLVLIWLATRWRPSLEFSFQELKGVVGFTSSTVGLRVLDYLNSRLEQFLIGASLGVIALGVYAVGQRFVELFLRTFYSTLGGATVRSLSIVQSDRRRLTAAFLDANRLVMLVSAPAFFGLAAISYDLIALFDPEWSKAAPIMIFASAGALLQTSTFFSASILTAVGKPHHRLIPSTISLVLCVVAFLIGKNWGIVGVAAAIVVRSYLLVPVSWAFVRREIDCSFLVYARALAPPIASAAAMTAVVLAARATLVAPLSPRARVFALATLGAIVYPIVLIGLFPSVATSALDQLEALLPKSSRVLRITSKLRKSIRTRAAARLTSPSPES